MPYDVIDKRRVRTEPFHTCHFAKDHPCQACAVNERAAREQNIGTYQAKEFVALMVEQKRLAPEAARAIDGDWLLMLGAAIRHGYDQAMQGRQSPDEAGGLDTEQRFDYIEFEAGSREEITGVL